MRMAGKRERSRPFFLCGVDTTPHRLQFGRPQATSRPVLVQESQVDDDVADVIDNYKHGHDGDEPIGDF